jgi:hypothetical protein
MKQLWRVVYGETQPTWERHFKTRREAKAFAQKHETFGDIVYSIARIVPSEPPQSLMAAIAKEEGWSYP